MIQVTSSEQYGELLNAEPKVIAMFTAGWCAPAKAITPEFESLSTQYETVAFLSIDIDTNEEVAGQYGASVLPMFIALREGQKVGTLKGADREGLRRMVRVFAAS
ncbi:thioredoxin family protein [Streptomyces longwoodensis]|uniref:thioredoxin family protein n=1 Tax=Streptomyces longwoodensis TaxID=68231 RepID=UPI0033E8EFDC